MKIILILIILFVLLPIVRIVFGVWRSVHNMKKAFNQQFGQQQQNSQQQYQEPSQADTNKQNRKQRAVNYIKNASEDAEYETISTERRPSFVDTGNSQSRPKSRYSDAQFEEVK